MIFAIIEDIRNTSSKNEKIKVLLKNKENETLQKVLFYTYNPLFTYYTKHQVDTSYVLKGSASETMIDVFHHLDKLINREVTGNAAANLLDAIGEQMSCNDRTILNQIIKRDLRCGISEKSINKVWPKLIPEIPYMRCSSMSELGRIKYPAIAQRKADGVFCNAIYKSGSVSFQTRNGSEFSLDMISNEVDRICKGFRENVVLNGELLVLDGGGKEMPRKIGNGLINSLIKKHQTLETILSSPAKTPAAMTKKGELHYNKCVEFANLDSSLKYVVWDVVPLEDWLNGASNLAYSMRLAHLRHTMSFYPECNHVHCIETKEVNSLEEATEFYLKQISQGHEGAVIKNMYGLWKNHTSPNQVKMKAEKDCDLRVVGYEPGTGKYVGGIGSLVCESSDGKLVVSIGYGLSDAERGFTRKDLNDSSKGLVLLDGFDPNQYNGTIIAVKYNTIITSKSKDTYSLFLPKAEELNRLDKDEADSLDKILKG